MTLRLFLVALAFFSASAITQNHSPLGHAMFYGGLLVMAVLFILSRVRGHW